MRRSKRARRWWAVDPTDPKPWRRPGSTRPRRLRPRLRRHARRPGRAAKYIVAGGLVVLVVLFAAAGADDPTTHQGPSDFDRAVYILLALVAYWVPTLVALWRKPPHFWSIFVVNLFLGWTLVGWVVALAMAVRDR